MAVLCIYNTYLEATLGGKPKQPFVCWCIPSPTTVPHHALLLCVLQTISAAGEAAQGAHSTAEANLLSAKQDQVYAHSLEDRANILNAEANSVALKRIQGSLLCAHMCVCTCVCVCVCVCDSWLGRPSLIPSGPSSPAHACPPSFPHPFSCCQPYSSPHLPPSHYPPLTPTPFQLSPFSPPPLLLQTYSSSTEQRSRHNHFCY